MSRDTWPRPEWSGYPVVDTSSSGDPDLAWFEIHKLRPNVYAIYEPGNWQEVMSYLFVGRHKAMLYDTGMNIGDIKHATDFLTDKPVFVVNSHFHPDHTGCNFEYDDVWAMRDRFARMFQDGWANEDVSGFLTGRDVAGVGDAAALRPGRLLHPALHDHALAAGRRPDRPRQHEVRGHPHAGPLHRRHLPARPCPPAAAGRRRLVQRPARGERPQGVHADRGEARQPGLQGRLHPAQPQLHDDLVRGGC